MHTRTDIKHSGHYSQPAFRFPLPLWCSALGSYTVASTHVLITSALNCTHYYYCPDNLNNEHRLTTKQLQNYGTTTISSLVIQW